MKQSKIDSALEALTNIFIGAGAALVAQLIWFPIIGKDFTFFENVITTVFFTLVSFVRSYGIRRLFNGRSVYLTIKNKLTRTIHCYNCGCNLPEGCDEHFIECESCELNKIKAG